MRSGVLPVGFCFRDRLEKVEVGFGVGEFIELLDLQASVFVGDYLCKGDHFTDHLHPNRGLYF